MQGKSVRRSFARLCAAFGIAAGMAACGGGGGGPAPVDAPRVPGILSGTIERNGEIYPLVMMASESGRFMGYDSGGWFYDGTYQVPGAFETPHSVTIFQTDPNYLNDGASFDHMGFFYTSVDLVDFVLTGTGAQGALAVGALTCPLCSPTLTLAPFTLTYDRDLDALDSSFQAIGGSWLFTNGNYQMALNVASNGTTSTTSKYQGFTLTCTSAGAAGIVDPAYNAYDWTTTASGTQCGGSDGLAPYDGMAFASPQLLLVLLNNGPRFLALGFVRPAP